MNIAISVVLTKKKKKKPTKRHGDKNHKWAQIKYKNIQIIQNKAGNGDKGMKRGGTNNKCN